jgi:hypothetical protein
MVEKAQQLVMHRFRLFTANDGWQRVLNKRNCGCIDRDNVRTIGVQFGRQKFKMRCSLKDEEHANQYQLSHQGQRLTP